LPAQGAAEKTKRVNDVHLRQLVKKNAYVPSFFLIFFKCVFGRFSARGVRKHGKKLSAFPKNSPGKHFFEWIF
jgi:hypothetical protein